MAHEETDGLTGWWKKLKNKASDTLAEQETGFVRGKVAGVAVTDAAGNILVAAGQRIDDAVIAQVRAAGKLAALAASVVQAKAQDARETVQTQIGKTETAKETRLLDSVEDYAAMRRYMGRVLTMDVTDIRGNIVVPAGKTLDHDDVNRAREAGLLSALLVASEQSLPAPPDSRPQAPSAPPPLRAPLLNGPEEEEA